MNPKHGTTDIYPATRCNRCVKSFSKRDQWQSCVHMTSNYKARLGISVLRFFWLFFSHLCSWATNHTHPKELLRIRILQKWPDLILWKTQEDKLCPSRLFLHSPNLNQDNVHTICIRTEIIERVPFKTHESFIKIHKKGIQQHLACDGLLLVSLTQFFYTIRIPTVGKVWPQSWGQKDVNHSKVSWYHLRSCSLKKTCKMPLAVFGNNFSLIRLTLVILPSIGTVTINALKVFSKYCKATWHVGND